MDLLSRTPPVANHRIHYGPDPSQFGDLWLPSHAPTHGAPLAIFFHGGWWQSAYDLAYGGHLCNALRADGLAVWSVEYRRVGRTGGGWPTTFQDAAAGFDYAAILARTFPLDLTHVAALGHSAGGHLAFWLVGRHHIDPHSPLHAPQPSIPLRGVLSLAGCVDLRLAIDLSGLLTYAHDKREVFSLMGGPPASFPDRYRAGNPGDLLPLSVRQVLIQGKDDAQVPPALAQRWTDNARRQGDDVTLHLLDDTGHFDVVDPQSKAWPTVRAAVLSLFS